MNVNIFRFLKLSAITLFCLFIPCGCGGKKSPEQGEKSHAEHAEEGHEHGSEGSGAQFKEGKGILLAEETRKALGLQVQEVQEQSIAPTIRVTAQIYRAASEPSRRHREQTGFAYATAIVAPEPARRLKPGQNVTFLSPIDKSSRQGEVWKLDQTQLPVLGKTEVLLRVPDSNKSLEVGMFLEASISLNDSSQKVVAIPRSAVLQTSEGIFAFVQNGEHLLRTAVKLGIENEGQVEVTDGLLEGDVVATSAVEPLYLIELRATKGGGHSH